MTADLYSPIPARVSAVRAESDDRTLRTFDLTLTDDAQPFDYLPGQFCLLSIPGKGEAAFGLASSPTEPGLLRFTVNRVGVVTTALHYLKEGETVGVRGPLGNHYPVDRFKGQDVVLVSGGFAFTTLRSLAAYILANRGDYGELTIIYGARRPGLMLYRPELAEWEKRGDVHVHLAIDQPAAGWGGLVGLVPDVTRKLAPGPDDAWAVVCGPPVMIKYTLPVLADLGFKPDRIYTSLERRMKCGVGKCGRCNVGPKYVCTDGPVFSCAEMKALPEAAL
ncbi:heterodisulfide reductase subunit F [candidate division WOR-3 bacterium]|nr:heterodisulfide reductase subunit F [candidate division WOR-3 bacterium]